MNTTGMSTRISAIDVVRGLIMVIMALDHTRDFLSIDARINPVNLQATTTLLFFTRWITHFCAPTFMFLSGVSAYLASMKRTPAETSKFLLKRGLWLVATDVVLMSLLLTFDPLYHTIFISVIWAIGMSMIILALLMRTSFTVIFITGLVLFFGHNLLDYVHLPKTGAGNVLMKLFFTAFGAFFPIGGGRAVFCTYAVLPWTGVLLLGYSIGKMFYGNVNTVKRTGLLWLGAALSIAFVAMRWINHYGDPFPWKQQHNATFTFLSFLNTNKYPPSLDYLCMTLGPTLMLLYAAEKINNRFTNVLSVYGKTPYFYYVVHFFVIRIISIIVFIASGYKWKQGVAPDLLMLFRPADMGFHLGGVYLLWITVVILLYYPCKWYYQFKRTHSYWWLSYC